MAARRRYSLAAHSFSNIQTGQGSLLKVADSGTREHERVNRPTGVAKTALVVSLSLSLSLSTCSAL